MIIRSCSETFPEHAILLDGPTVFCPEASKILLDDELTNAVAFDDKGYLYLTQSKGGHRLYEVELSPSEVQKLRDFLNSPSGHRCIRS